MVFDDKQNVPSGVRFLSRTMARSRDCRRQFAEDLRMRCSWLCFLITAVAALGMTAPSQGTPSRTYDVVVYGGTASGVITAVAAAREGARVALIEPRNHLGGVISGGLGTADKGREESIGGYSREFFERAGKKYGVPIQWNIEPHVAEEVFNEMAKEGGVEVFFRNRLRERSGVKKQGTRIAHIKLENGVVFTAKVFVDASYEGDLMAQAGVSYIVGRESRDQYGESLAGVYGHDRHFFHFSIPIRAYDEKGRLLPEISARKPGPPGSADKGVQTYNFRLCLTQVPDNRVPFAKPAHYDPGHYALLARYLSELDRIKQNTPSAATSAALEKMSSELRENLNRPWGIDDVLEFRPLRNGKTDANNGALAYSTNYVGASWDYPDGNYKKRERIWQAHIDYTQGLLYFLQHDPHVPQPLHDDLASWGLCKDEFVDNQHWPYQLYIREGRRMIGEYVIRQQDLQTEIVKSDSIGMGSYYFDSHPVQRLVSAEGWVDNEGGISMLGDNPYYPYLKPYQIPYRALLPKRAQATNLLVPVCLSATHVAYSSIRMEPVYMILGHAAGVAAKMAIDADTAVQDVDPMVLATKLRTQRAVLEW